MASPKKLCRNCKLFKYNPYNRKVGVCLDSAHDGVYEQVSADQYACEVGLRPTIVSAEDPQRKRCFGCNEVMSVDWFSHDPTTPDKLSDLCYKCKGKR